MLLLVHDELVLDASGERDVVETVVCAPMAEATELHVTLGVWVGIVAKRTATR